MTAIAKNKKKKQLYSFKKKILDVIVMSRVSGKCEEYSLFIPKKKRSVVTFV